jgi:hypothetical protein
MRPLAPSLTALGSLAAFANIKSAWRGAADTAARGRRDGSAERVRRKTTTSVARAVIILFFPLAVASSCSGDAEVVIATYSPARGTSDVGLSGTLAAHSGCIMLRTEGAGYFMLVWPTGFSVGTDASGQTAVVRPDGNVAAAVGDRVTLDGGPTGALPPGIPAECETKHMFRVWDVTRR